MRRRPKSTLFPYTTLFRSGRPAQTELTLRMPDGTTVAVQLVSRLAPVGQGERCVHTAITDISAFKKTQRVLEARSEEHTSELQSLAYLVCRLLLEKKKTQPKSNSNSPQRRAVSHRAPGRRSGRRLLYPRAAAPRTPYLRTAHPVLAILSSHSFYTH